MKKVIERIRTAASLAVLIALAAGGAGAATVTTVGGVGDDVTVQNVTGNAGGYVWNTTTMTLTLPAKENLPRGSAVEIVSVEMVEVGTSTQYSIQYGIPATLTIGSATATLDNSEAYDGTLFGAVNNAKLAKYEFAEGSRPVFMVGLPSAVSMTFSGNSTRLRALPTNLNGDSTDLVVGVGNTQYQPCIRITGKIVSTSVYTATTEATSANFSELTWSPSISGVDTSSASLVINAPNLATLTIDETRTAGSLFVDSAASTLTVNQLDDNVLTTKGLGVNSSIWFKIDGTAPLTICDGGIKGASEIYVSAGTTLNLSDVACPAKINAYGTVKTAGSSATLLSNSDNRFQQTSSHLNVTQGNTFVSSPAGGYNGISKQITIASGARLSAVSTDGLSYNQSGVVVDVYGTLEFYNGCYWSTGNNTINLHEGAVICGSQTGSRGTLDFNNTSTAKINVYGNAEITAAVRPNYSSVGIYVKEGKTLAISAAPIIAAGGSFAKTGDGTLQFKNIALIPVTGSEGSVELLNDSSSHIRHTNALAFSGNLKVSRNGSGHIAIGGDDADTTGGNVILTGAASLDIGGSSPYLCLNRQVAGNWLSIKNLSASSSDAKIDSVFGGGDSDTYVVKTLKSLQTENTIFAGTFNGNSNGRRVDLEVYGQNEMVRSLTLSGNNTKAYGTLTIRDYGKVVFDGSGNWSQGTVVVDEHGYIESKNSRAIASSLTICNGATIVVPTVNDAVVPLNGTTVTLPDDGKVYFDLSGIAAETDDVVTVLSATTLNNSGTAAFAATSGSWRFAVNGSTVTATKLGTLAWDGDSWSDDDFTGYVAAAIAVTGTQTVTLPDSASLDTLTLTGSGEVSIASTESETISARTITIGNGVTLNASSALTLSDLTISNEGESGTGSLKIPDGVTCTMEDVTCTARIYCYGNLNTRGDTDLSCASTAQGSWSYFYSGSKLTVETGETKIRAEEQGLKGNIEIAAGATLTENRGYDDGLDFNSTLTIDVKGTLLMGSQRWIVGAGNTINIFEGASITGSEAVANGNLDWKDAGCVVNVYGDANIDACLRFRSGCNATVNVAEGKTLTIKKPFATSTATGTLTKSGAGTLRLEDAMRNSAGNTNEPTIAGSEGIVEFFSKTEHRYMNKQATFSGKVKFTQDSTQGKELIVNSTTLFANRPSLEVSGGFTMHSNLAADNVALEVSNLSGSGTISPKFGEQATARIVDTKQTTETVFRGVFSHHQSQGDRKTGLVVRGDGTTTVHSLTLTAENGTTGPLTVLNYGKVIFGENASWGNGTVTVGANGYLESTNAAAVTKLTLQDGAHIVFPAATSSLGGISELAFATGTTYISFPDGVTPTDGAMLIDWGAANLEAAPEGEFAFADSTLAGEWILTKSAAGLSIAAAGAQIVYSNGDVVPCAAVDASTYAAFMTAIGTDEGATLRILDNTSIDTETITTLASQGLYYDSATKTISKAVAKVNTAVYPSLASAVAAASDGNSVYLLRASSEMVTINAKAITLVQTAAFSGTLSGNGTITLQTLSTSLHFDSWTGTVALPPFTGDPGISFNQYGIAGSTVRVSASNVGWLKNETVDPNIELGGDWSLPYFSASFPNTLPKLSGAHKFTLAASEISYTEAAQTPYFLIKDISDFTGSLETTAAGIVLGAASKPSGRDHGGKILVYGNVAVGETATWTAPNGVVLMEDSATLTVPSGATVPKVATSVDNSYAKAVAGESSTVYSVDEYNTVAFAGDNYTLGSVMTNGAAVAVSEGSCKVEDGAITFTVAPNNGYAVTGVTAGGETLTAVNGTYSYTVEGNVTITVTTVSTSLTIGAATVEYLADYSKAKTVSATVTDGTVLDGTTWTLKTNGVAVAGAMATYANGTVTFSNISVTLGDSITYSIEASNGSTGTSAESAASTVGNVTGGWIVEDKDNSGSTGAWTTGLTYTDGVATITDANTYTPTKPGDGIVTLETVVKFGNEADPEVAVGDGAQAAVKIANSKFAVYGKTASDGTAGWQSTAVDADVDATYTVKLVINYNTGTFTISVKKNGAETATPLGGTWYLATAATKVSSIAYTGTGAFTSLNGSFISGDVDVTVDETGVAVSSDFISAYLAGKTVTEAAAALAPDATLESNPAAFAAGGNGLNYFTSYALGLDPTKEEDKPIVDVTVVNGNYVFTVKHPVYNEQGKIIGYEEINAADNVSTTVTLKYGTDASSITTVEKGAASGISPADMFDHAGAGNVLYYKAEVTIGAK